MTHDITLYKTPDNLFFQVIHKKEEIKDLNSDGILLDCDEKEARRTIEFIKSKSKTIKIAIIARDEEFNRRALETLKINYLISPEYDPLKDSLKQRASGFNHVLAEIANKKNITIVVDLTRLNQIQNKKYKAIILSRIIQNIKICRKTKCPIKFVTLAKNETELLDEKQIQSIGFSLGMSSQQAKTCFQF